MMENPDENLDASAPAEAPADPLPETPDAPTPVDPSLLERVEHGLQEMKAEVQAMEQAVVAEVQSVVHTIERRTFGRASADEPMPTTTITGN
jgi:hypothetical protein